ncbi:gas vesicle protein [Nonomuraea sp. NPDC050643]|uniref:gas vesicle protein GvpO n=1 Tax=Nonomuraea sp. NPDC050643 TaxID=3155660 RepID=UPI00340F0797
MILLPARQGTESDRTAHRHVADDRREAEPSREITAELPAAEAGEAGLHAITSLTGKEVEGVTLVEPTDDGWLVGVEVVEDRRIPSSGDILALYNVDLDMGGNLLSYRRTRRYKRASGAAAEGAW